MEAVQVKLTSNGQISLPAEIRHRWHAKSMIVIDRGEYVIVRPMPDDPIGALYGAHAGPGPTTEKARAIERQQDAEREEQRLRASGGTRGKESGTRQS
jgi:bifunctional DNA-binding transcriptional regulator/antitoxin component of YhaV-PrlF toxin-antitoxin module